MKLRLILDGELEGYENMAIDGALLETAAESEFSVTLRFYHWSRPTLSMGYFQPARSLDIEGAKRAGLCIVRRPTGGRAVIHERELTYSVVSKPDVPLGKKNFSIFMMKFPAGLWKPLKDRESPFSVRSHGGAPRR